MSDFKEQNDKIGRSFVMPLDEFIKIVNENLDNGYYNVGNIAKRFGVSVEDVIKRGKELKLWNGDNIIINYY